MDSFLEFYGSHNISPVRQDISDLDRHFRRRLSLYRHLGVLPGLFSGRRVLEIGPGSGHNSLVNASFAPSCYHLIEGNKTGVEDTTRLFAEFPQWNNNIEIFNCKVEEFAGDASYDVVICEGMLTGQPDPIATLLRIGAFVAPGGVLIITCIDSLSYLSEGLRYLVGNLLIGECRSLEERLAVLLPVFTPHLERLAGMSRRKDDWIVDNILNPAAIGPTLSMSDAIGALDCGFDVYGSSPRLFRDWRWYKTICEPESGCNELAREQYWSLAHNLADHTNVHGERDPAQNAMLYALCDRLRALTATCVVESRRELLPEIGAALAGIEEQLAQFNPSSAAAVAEVAALTSRERITAEEVHGCTNFTNFFGRGQQHLSFVRSGTPAGAGRA